LRALLPCRAEGLREAAAAATCNNTIHQDFNDFNLKSPLKSSGSLIGSLKLMRVFNRVLKSHKGLPKGP
jgi:hypothetical protein